MIPDRYGQPKIHPAVDSQKSAAATFLAAMKSLALDELAGTTHLMPGVFTNRISML